MTGEDHSDQAKKEFNLENPSRHLMDIKKKQDETTSFLRIMMWIIFFLSIVVAYLVRISLNEGKIMIKKTLISCKIIKDDTKKTKYS